VTGNSRYTVEEIIAATGVEPGDNLVLMDRYGIQQRLFVNLPYIIEARINPKLPSTLRIDVTETTAAASIGGGGTNWLIDIEGKLLEPVEGETAQGCLQITGVEADGPTLGTMLVLPEESPVSRARLGELLAVLQEREVLDKTERVDLSDPEKLILYYDGRFQVEIYYDADFDYKLQGLLEVVALLEPNEQGIIRMTMKDDDEVRFIPSG